MSLCVCMGVGGGGRQKGVGGWVKGLIRLFLYMVDDW